MAAKSPIQKWLSSKKKDYQTGVKLYAEHPTAMRGLVNTLQRKENDFNKSKLEYALRKAAEAEKTGRAKDLKKKEQPSTKKPRVRKKTAKAQPVKKAPNKPTPPPMGKVASQNQEKIKAKTPAHQAKKSLKDQS